MAERKSKDRQYEVLVSFDGLDVGERFTDSGSGWARAMTESGYLRDVTDAPTVLQAQGEVAPVADPERVEEAKNAGEVGKG